MDRYFGEIMIAFLTLGGLGANPLRGGEENRAKDAKDAKVKGKKDEGTRYRDWPLPTHQLSRPRQRLPL